MELNELGITDNLRDKLLDHFGSPQALVEALDEQDVSSISAIPGISEKKACDIVLDWNSTGVRDLLRTEQAQRIFNGIIERVLEFANTPQTRNKVKLLRPLADKDKICEQSQFIRDAKKAVSGLDQDSVARNLKRLKPFTPAKAKFDSELLYIAENEEIYTQWDAKGIPKWAYLTTPDESPNPNEFSLVVYLYDTGELSFDGLDNVVMVQAESGLAEAMPDCVLADFENNYNVLNASRNLATLLGRDTLTEEALEVLDSQKAVKMDPEEFENWVETKKDLLNQEISKTIKSTQFTGDQVVDLLSQDLPEPIHNIYSEAFAGVREEARVRFGVHMLPFKEEFPVQVDEDAVETVKRRIGTLGRLDEWEERTGAAARLQKLRRPLEDEINALIDYDLSFCLGRFAQAYDLNTPTADGTGFRFRQGLSLDFYGFDTRQFIDYDFGGSEQDRVIILTGANSGGKTSLLETLTQMAVMAATGLGVRAQEASIPLFDEVYYYQQKRSLDAGGFETFLKGFLPLCLNPENKKRLVLADELESITELEAASKIISTFIEELKSSGSYGIIVTHMAKEISSQVEVRIDGIEATGLDEDLNLIVDRTPKIQHFARSTPELILRKLLADSKGDERQIYDKVLSKF